MPDEKTQLNVVADLPPLFYQHGGDDPGSDYEKRIVIKQRKDRTVFVKLDTSPTADAINPVELNLFMRHLQAAFRGYAGEAYRRNAAAKARVENIHPQKEQHIPISGGSTLPTQAKV